MPRRSTSRGVLTVGPPLIEKPKTDVSTSRDQECTPVVRSEQNRQAGIRLIIIEHFDLVNSLYLLQW